MYVVSQQDLIDEIISAPAEESHITVAYGRAGIGKTSIVRHLREISDAGSVALIPCSRFDPGHYGEVSNRASLGAVQASFQKFSDILRQIVEQLAGGAAGDSVHELALQTRQSEVYEARIPSFEENLRKSNEPIHPDRLIAAWRHAASQVSGAFNDRWRNLGVPNKSLLLFDDFDALEDQEIGVWLAELLPKLAGAQIVLTRTSEQPLPLFEPRLLRSRQVRPFDEDSVRNWLLEKDKAVSADLLRQICDVSGGHPATLSLIYEIVWQSPQSPPRGAHPLLANLPTQPDLRLLALTERFMKGPREDPLLIRILEVASIPRTFDEDLLFTLLRASDTRDQMPEQLAISRDQFDRSFDALKTGYSFIEDVSDLGETDDATDTENKTPRLQLHSVIRLGLLDRLRKDKDRYSDLNRAAADYYEAQITDEERKDSPYGEASLYEIPSWQLKKREWLYHLGLSSNNRDKKTAIIELSYVFFEALWWWGNYVHFDFCDQLVSDIGTLSRSRKDWAEMDSLHRALSAILEGYPIRSAKPSESPWLDVRDNLNLVQDLCGLEWLTEETDADKLKDRERRVAALLNVFWAHTWRYSKEDGERAQDCYDLAAEQFDADWSRAWVHFERADLYFEDGDRRQAIEFWNRSVKFRDRADEELAANLHRLMGDFFFELHDWDSASRAYGRSVLHAYLFNLVNGNPDEYTMQFYIDVRGVAVRRLFELWPEQKADVLHMAMRMASELKRGNEVFDEQDLKAFFGDGYWVQVALALFPKGPEVEELERDQTEFSKGLRRLRNSFDQRALSRDLKSYELYQ